MRYHIRHRTIYDYDEDVSLSHHLARLTPSSQPHQRLQHHHLQTAPAEATRSEHTDHFGNVATFLTIEGPHRQLEITALSTIDRTALDIPAAQATVPWESLRDQFAADPGEFPATIAEFVVASPLVPLRPEFAGYARGAFTPARPVLDAAIALGRQIHRDFAFDPRATHVTTPVTEFHQTRRGVCQDFAHFMIACLRSLGLPARYVSGYLETLPPPGQTKLVGADASHAWVALWCGETGWVDLDPTNDLIPNDRHIILAHGRDFSDVSPVRGVILGSGAHKLSVAVDVLPCAAEEETANRGATITS